MRDANREGEFSDPVFWDHEVIPTFASYYLDAYAAWNRGDNRTWTRPGGSRSGPGRSTSPAPS